jgi:hypothetical protein
MCSVATFRAIIPPGCYNKLIMQKPITFLLLALIIIVVAILAILWVLNVIAMEEAIDLGWKLVAVLAIGLGASLAVGMLGKNTAQK